MRALLPSDRRLLRSAVRDLRRAFDRSGFAALEKEATAEAEAEVQDAVNPVKDADLTTLHRQVLAELEKNRAKGDNWATVSAALPGGGTLYYSIRNRASNSRGVVRGSHLFAETYYQAPGEQYSKKVSAEEARRLLSGGSVKDEEPEPISPDTTAAFSEAVKQDRLGFMRGVKTVELVSDDSKWNAAFEPNRSAIVLQQKFEAKPREEKVQILLHEAGHSGQYLEPETYAAYLEAGLNKLVSFLRMANCVHLQDWQENGIDERPLAEETFAESYSRFCLGREMPDEILQFWQKRAVA